MRIGIISGVIGLFVTLSVHAQKSDSIKSMLLPDVVVTSLSFFTEPQPIEFHCTLTLVPYEPIIYQDKVVCKRTYSHHLRGPPVA